MMKWLTSALSRITHENMPLLHPSPQVIRVIDPPRGGKPAARCLRKATAAHIAAAAIAPLSERSQNVVIKVRCCSPPSSNATVPALLLGCRAVMVQPP